MIINAITRRACGAAFAAAIIAGASLSALAAEPNGYYSSCVGLSGARLLSSLENVVGSHTTISYKGLWDAFEDTDTDASGKVIDMYSNKLWKFGTEQCGNYSNVGSCYNREHSFPKSWFNDASPMYSDIFHLYPTDGYVNNQRSNYPFGVCANGKRLSNGSLYGKGKLGKSTYSGYSGTVFEPDDEYKGDFARTYFYMMAAYNSRVSSWDSDQLAGNAYPGLSSWSVKMFLEWHELDPVSDKERARQEAAYKLQHNRNPFIDHPELVDHIWGDLKNTGWTGKAQDPETAEFISPADGAKYDMGTIALGMGYAGIIYVKTVNLTTDITVTQSPASTLATRSTIKADEANYGIEMPYTFTPKSEGKYTVTLTFTAGSLKRSVTVSGNAVDYTPEITVTAANGENPLTFVTRPGAISDVETVNLEIVNYDDDVLVTVDAPFEVSDDRASWSTGIILDPDADHFYVRLNGENVNASVVNSCVTVTTNDFENTSLALSGIISASSLNSVVTNGSDKFDAWSPGSNVLTVAGPAAVRVYGLDGVPRYAGRVAYRENIVVPAGLYIVVDDNSGRTRRVIVR